MPTENFTKESSLDSFFSVFDWSRILMYNNKVKIEIRGATMSKKTFLKGAIILGIAGLIIKVMGAFFRIPLANIIGEEGMGYYQTAYPIYVFLLVFSTAGIPTAISKMVSERIAEGNQREANRVFRVSFALLTGLGIVTSAILFFGAEIIANILKNPGAMYSLRAISPALLIAPLMSAFRGYFQGMQDMKPTATSQIVEQFFRVAGGLSLAYILLAQGLEKAASGASSGAALGAVGGLLAVVLIYLKRKPKIYANINKSRGATGESAKKIIYKIFVIAVPITLGAAIMPVMSMIDVAIVMRRLQEAGFTAEAANGLYGQLSGMAAPLINFPQALTMGIAMSLVPAIAAANQSKDTKFLQYNVELGVRTAMLISLPCTAGMMILSEPIMLLLYPLQKTSAVSAAGSLFILAIGIVLLAIVQTLTGTLQGIGKQTIPVRNLVIGAIFKVICTFSLVGIPSINVKGAAIGTILAYGVAAILNLHDVKKYTGAKFNINLTVLRPLISVFAMSITVYLVFIPLSSMMKSSFATALSILIGAMTYFIAILMTKSITLQELETIPGGRKLQKIALIVRKR